MVVSIGSFLAGAYVYVIYHYIKGWRRLPEWGPPKVFTPQTKVTVVIPARNEAGNILACLQGITAQNYPLSLYEILVVDDHSTDDTTKLVEAFCSQAPDLTLLRLSDHLPGEKVYSFKKKAIDLAISKAKGSLIVTTDADCVVPPNWLKLLVSFFEEKKLQFIAAPVNFHQERSLFERFQSLDFIGMMGLTGAGIELGWMNMCNGANLAYAKSAFQAIDGFSDIDQLASGDDILLMQKMAHHFPGQIGFLKSPEACVLTQAKPDLSSFLAQRLRWATKSSKYQERTMILILALVLFLCLGIIGSAVLALFGGWPWLLLSLSLLLVKSIADFFFLKEMSAYFGRTDLMKSFWSAQLLHLLYIAFVGTVSNFKKRYVWKGRSLR